MSANLKALTSVTAGTLISQQLAAAEAALYTVPAATTVKIDQGSLCNVSANIVPALTLGATATTGGTLAAGATFWKVTAVNAAGQSLGSNEVSAVLTGTTSSQPLSWTVPVGAVSYNVYRGTTAGGENILVANVTTNSYTDAGGAGTPATTPPSTSTYGTPVTVYLSIVKAGGVIGDGTHRVINGATIQVNDTLPLKDYISGHMLGPGDIIAGYSGLGTSIDLVISGTVLS